MQRVNSSLIHSHKKKKFVYTRLMAFSHIVGRGAELLELREGETQWTTWNSMGCRELLWPFWPFDPKPTQ